MCSGRCFHSNVPGMLRTESWSPFRTVQTASRCPRLESSFFYFELNGLWTLFCCRYCWRSCRSGWFSIFSTSFRTRKLSACFETECGKLWIRKSMSRRSALFACDMMMSISELIGFGVTRNTYCTPSKFSEKTQAEKMVDGTGKFVGENSSKGIDQDFTRKAETDDYRRVLRENWSSRTPSSSSRSRTPNSTRKSMAATTGFSWSSQNLTKNEGITKIPKFYCDTLARKKLIEDQNSILELSGRLQELQKWSKLYERF